MDRSTGEPGPLDGRGGEVHRVPVSSGSAARSFLLGLVSHSIPVLTHLTAAENVGVVDELLIVGVTGNLGLLGLEGLVSAPTLTLNALRELFFRTGGVSDIWVATPAPGLAEDARDGLSLPPNTF